MVEKNSKYSKDSVENARYSAINPHYDGECLHIYPGYTEFRPHEKNMNVANCDFTGFVPNDERTREELAKKHAIHNEYLENYFDDYDDKTQSQISAYLRTESRLYAQPESRPRSSQSARGNITNISKKSATRLKKMMSRVPGLDLWIDLTFSDDVFHYMNFSERLKKSYDCLNEFQRVIRKKGIHYIWKKEIMPRLSGDLQGCRIPHYHVALCGLSEKQKRNYKALSIELLTTWVRITGTKNPNALLVALHQKNGKASSYRLIEDQKRAGQYIGKYFSKTDKIKGRHEGSEKESIGRTWGNSKNIPQISAWRVNLTRDESIVIRRLLRRGLRLKKSKFIGLREQLTKGWATYLFLQEDLIVRLINKYCEDPWKTYEPLPF